MHASCRPFLLLFVFVIVGCSTDDLTSNLLGNQTERLLSGQNGSKVWDQIIDTSNCLDSVFLFIESEVDSLDISYLNRTTGCLAFDTLYVGRASASVSSTDIFTDSLLFASGDHWIVNELTSQRLSIEIQDSQRRFLAD